MRMHERMHAYACRHSPSLFSGRARIAMLHTNLPSALLRYLIWHPRLSARACATQGQIDMEEFNDGLRSLGYEPTKKEKSVFRGVGERGEV